MGEPILVRDVQLSGVAAEAAQAGEAVKLWVRLGLTSDDPGFHVIADSVCGGLQHLANQAGKLIDLRSVNMLVLVVRPDNSGELWADTAAWNVRVLLKRSVEAGAAIFERDIGDVTGMWFPLLNITEEDRLVVLFREGWAFGLFFHLNTERDLNLERTQQELGRLYRTLRYRHLYDAVANAQVFDRIVGAGWFPFVEILGEEFQELASHCSAGFPLEGLETKLVDSFDQARLDHLLARWSANPRLRAQMPLFEASVRQFKARDPISAIKIGITEIEGVLRAAYPPTPGTRPNIRDFLKDAVDSAIRKSGAPDTLLLPEAFSLYLKDYTFAQFDPSQGTGKAKSRHAVSHGAAAAESYTMARALQILLTIDQLAFYN